MPARVIAVVTTIMAAAGCEPYSLLFGEHDPLYCDTTADCSDGARPFCDSFRHECVSATPPDMGTCTAHKDCPADRPVCEMGACRACAAPSDDAACASRSAATPRCAPTGGSCIACRAATQATDCTTPSLPVCDDRSSACRACAANRECASGACLPSGACAPAADVYLVDNGGKKVADCKAGGGQDGSPARPFCDVQDAVAAMPARPYIAVTGSAESYGSVVIADRTLTLLGPGISASPHAVITAAGGTSALVVNATTMAAVTVDGFELTSTIQGKPGVNCNPNGTASLTLTRSWVHDNSGAGVQATSCTLTVGSSRIDTNTGGGIVATGSTLSVDANRIHTNLGGGIKVTGGTYAITNNFLYANNGVTAPGVVFDDVASGTFAFNTVVFNLRSTFGGVNCGFPMNPRPLESSIIWGNSLGSGSQFAGTCKLTNVVTGMDSATDGTKLDPAFVDTNTSDFHLKANDPMNAACCVDKVASPMSPNKDHDADGSKRPKGAAWDIGAHEVM